MLTKPCVLIATLTLLGVSSICEAAPARLMGDWSIAVESGLPAWLRVTEEEGQTRVRFRLYVGPEGPYDATELDDGRLRFQPKMPRGVAGADADTTTVEVGLADGQLTGVLTHTRKGQPDERVRLTGKRIPPMPATPPDLARVKFGRPIRLFNGEDLSGWRPHEADKINGWSAEGGVLVNETPKTDFSATGAYANLRTEAEFKDFWLHLEFYVEAKRNSGVYLRGLYEAQVVDRDSPMQGRIGVGSIFGQIAPSQNAGRPGGEWQAYDLTLVDRHVTVELNGVRVIDNEPVSKPTPGAIHTDPMAPGPIYLQGDHTAVKYRNLYLAPVID
ncbi:hypothetical protein MalM25_31520 [Planctomycetes bacterium MalM25]|nr:hypothetical protein MalM25_31520 [Planctomycetes bacterium MalM25]